MKTISDPNVASALAERLQRVSSTEPRIWGSMTAHQMLVQVAGTTEAALGRQPFPQSRRPPSRVLKWAALTLPLRWPRGITGPADPAARALPPETFDADRDRAVEQLSALASASGTTLCPQHPIFGPMSRRNWHRWAFLHTDHHLRQFGL